MKKERAIKIAQKIINERIEEMEAMRSNIPFALIHLLLGRMGRELK